MNRTGARFFGGWAISALQKEKIMFYPGKPPFENKRTEK